MQRVNKVVSTRILYGVTEYAYYWSSLVECYVADFHDLPYLNSHGASS